MARLKHSLNWYAPIVAQAKTKRSLASTVRPIVLSLWKKVPDRLKVRFPRLLKGVARRTLGVKALKADERVAGLKDGLWMGFSRRATEELTAVAADISMRKRTRVEARRHLAMHAAEAGDFERALVHWNELLKICDAQTARRDAIPYCALLTATGRGAEAEQWLVAPDQFDQSYEFMSANAWHPIARPHPGTAVPTKAIEHLNAVFSNFKISTIALADPEAPVSIDNLVGVDSRPRSIRGPLVSVIVPAYNAQDTILTALRSLAQQTWADIEVLVVDDASSDATTAIVEDFAASDGRFKLLRQTVNGGSYASRNRALSEANGKYVTIHDADDWVHPQRIEAHAEDLETGLAGFNLSNWIRSTPDLFFPGNWRRTLGYSMTMVNYGSLFFRRDLTETLGGWNEVRVSGDREFVRRLEKHAGNPPRRFVAGGAPLALGRVLPTSLTRVSATQLNTMHHGVRREYHEATDYWHRLWQSGAIGIEELNRRVPAAAPLSIRSRAAMAKYDLVLIGDWNMKGGTFHSAKNMALAALREGLTVAFLHYPRHDHPLDRSIDKDVRGFIYANDIAMIAPGERLAAVTVVVTYPALFDELMDRFPSIEHERLVVVVNQMAERDTQGSDTAYNVQRVQAHLLECLGSTGEWVPISNWVRKIMLSDPRYPRPSPQTWTPMVDDHEWLQHQAVWRGRERPRPRLGRHGRDHRLKWPGEAATILTAYCAGKPCDVRFLGGAKKAAEVVGRWPRNWEVLPFGGDVKSFLADLDFFLHFPHETYIEEFGRAPMEAMAIGVPVILPPVFEQTFGDAALYAEADAVWPLIERLWADEAAWMERVAAGRRFVVENCSYDVLRGRLNLPATAEIDA